MIGFASFDLCGQLPGARYVGVFAAAASISSTVISGVNVMLTPPVELIINDTAVALASSGKSTIPTTSSSPNA